MPTDDQLKQHVGTNAQQVFDILRSIAAAGGIPVDDQSLKSMDAAANYVARTAGYQSTWSMAIAVLDAVLGGFVKVLGKVREAGVEGLPELTAEVLNEFLGTQFTGQQFGVLSGPDATLQRAHQIGTAVLGQLEREFTQGGKVTPASAEEGAKRMAGFALNFGIQTGLLALLGGAVPIAHLDEVREMGVEAARNIGLGRLVRQALRPLVQETITTPYGRALKAKYQQDLLAPAEYIRQFLAGRINHDQLLERLRQHGFTDDDIDELTRQHVPDLNMLDELRLERYKELTRDAIIQDLRDRGWTLDYATKRTRAEALSRVDSEWSKYLTKVEELAAARWIDKDTAAGLVQAAPLYDEEAQRFMARIGLTLEYPHKQPTWAQVTTLYEIGAVDLNYVDDWLNREGFSADDNLNMTLLLLYKFEQAQDKAEAAAAKAKAKQQKQAGQPAQTGPQPGQPGSAPLGGV